MNNVLPQRGTGDPEGELFRKSELIVLTIPYSKASLKGTSRIILGLAQPYRPPLKRAIPGGIPPRLDARSDHTRKTWEIGESPVESSHHLLVLRGDLHGLHHKDCLARRLCLRHRESALTIELDGIWCHVRRQLLAPLFPGELFDQPDQCASMAAPLTIFPDRHAAHNCRCASDINSHDAHHSSAPDEQHWVITWRGLIRALWVVNAELAAGLEQHATAYVVIRRPVVRIPR